MDYSLSLYIPDYPLLNVMPSSGIWRVCVILWGSRFEIIADVEQDLEAFFSHSIHFRL